MEKITMATQNEQDNEIILDGGRATTGKNKQNFKGIIVGLVIFILIFIGSCSMLKSCGGENDGKAKQTPQEQINAMVAADHALGTIRRTREPEGLNSEINDIVDKIGQETAEYADKLINKINTSDMPEDYRVAYLFHAKAWKKKADIYLNHPHLPTGFFSSLKKDFTGELTDVRIWANKAIAIEEEISATWKEVGRIGAKYGVSIQ